MTSNEQCTSFSFNNISFGLLYLITFFICEKILYEINQSTTSGWTNSLAYATDISLLVFFFTLLFSVILIAKSMIHITPETVDREKATKSLLICIVLFHIAILSFYINLFIWNSYFGGSQESIFIGILTTAPVFFLFGRTANYKSLVPGVTVNRTLHSLYITVRIIIVVTYVVYLFSILTFDIKIFKALIDIEIFNSNPLLEIFTIDEANIVISKIKSTNIYKLLDYLILVGSVLVTICATHNKQKSKLDYA